MKKTLSAVTVLITLGFAQLANAEYYGFMIGRSADLTKLADLSVEGGYVSGDVSNIDYDNIGVRVNYRASPGMILYGDIAKTDVGNADGTPFGIGLFYQLQDLVENMDTALRGSFHTGDVSVGNQDFDVENLALDIVFSGREPLSENGMEWYGNLGLHRLKVGNNSDSELSLGAGIVLPVGAGEGYFGIAHVDEISFGFGFRYNL